MSDYMRIDNMQDADQAYCEVVRIFGKSILNDKYRMIGAFLDIAPKMKEEASYLIKAFDAGVPQYFASAAGLEKGKASEMLKSLQAKGLSNDVAIDLLENLGRAVGIRVNIRPDYSKGGEIPYAAKKNDDLNTAVRKLDHIRWFLNNSNRYQMRGFESELKDMRKLMNNPQRNEAELISQYDSLVHKFQNNPFEESFVFDKGKDADIKSTSFGAYFIVAGGTPVALEFARQYGGTDYNNGLKAMKAKYSAMVKRVEGYHNEVSAISVSSKQNGGKKGKAIAFIIVAVIIMLTIRNWLTLRFAGSGLLSFWNVLKENHFAIWKVFAGIPSVSHPVGYSVILIISALILMCAIILIVNLCKTIRNIARAKGPGRAVNKKNKLEHAFGKTIPDKLKAVMDDMGQYVSGKKDTLELTMHDYRSVVKEIQVLKNTKTSRVSALVAQGGKTALGWMIALTVIASIMSVTQLSSAAKASAAEIGSIVTLKEELAETVIPTNAIKFGDHYYAIYDDAQSWKDAYDQCKKLGGHLATISSEEEDIAVISYLKNQDVDVAFLGLIYTSNSEHELNWYWYGYEELSYVDWTEGEPSLGDDEDCLYGAMCQSDNYQWRALPIDYTNYYVCEWESLDAGKVDQRLLNIPIGSMAYNGHYYALLDGAETYDDAVEMCEKLGGYMCVINDGDENTVLYDYMHKREHDSAYFGYSDQDLEGKWKWAYSEEASDYTNWAEGEPNGDTNENYGMFYFNSPEYCWNDGNWGGENEVFFCEWDLTQTEEDQEAE